ncbi:hypothetical protein GALMADRAFT_245549 [Galerina marginata CBS 339.88]|uniref:Uncharacterized protein n=1 Tax=Galerina marginata (strain CBS 339.88) TaxID=685588 RepID=A0A067T5I8_GALM3|nr:hypothetical protein GALMADRAFT_245549 [Galerina marginata CBS 339.88]
MQNDSANSKKFTFYGKDLDEKATLLLAFTPPPEAGTLFQDLFPLCWKVVVSSPEDTSPTVIDFTFLTAFFVPVPLPNDLIEGLPFMPCNTGELCTLVATQQGNIITPSIPAIPGYLACANATPAVAKIGLGFLDAKLPIVQPSLLWNHVPTGTQAEVRIVQYLEIYATDEFQETQIIRDPIPAFKLVWKKNLQTLGQKTSFEITVDSITGGVLVNDYQVI